MSFCTQCDRPCLDKLCVSCVEATQLGNKGVVSSDHSCYNDRLSAGFALIAANENPGNYNDLWS